MNFTEKQSLINIGKKNLYNLENYNLFHNCFLFDYNIENNFKYVPYQYKILLKYKHPFKTSFKETIYFFDGIIDINDIKFKLDNIIKNNFTQLIFYLTEKSNNPNKKLYINNEKLE